MSGKPMLPDNAPALRPYVGRFAPSPTGRLHIGTLTAAAASFLHARQAGGEWLLRIEDVDPPREVPGAADSILHTLEWFGLHWDRSILYQSSRLDAYREAAEGLLASGQAFRCRCSRQSIQALTGGSTRYPGTCRDRALAPAATAVRLRVEPGYVSFRDGICGPTSRDIAATEGDFVIFRRDGLPAYHLAVVIDDAFQNVTSIVRGRDLLESTALHLELQRRLGLGTPRYWHIPIVATAAGEKLSKGSGARPVDLMSPPEAVALTLELLGCKPPSELRGAPPPELWQWALRNWRIETLTGRIRTPAPED